MAISKSLAICILAVGVAGFVSVFILPGSVFSSSEYALVRAIPFVSFLLIGVGGAALKANSLRTPGNETTTNSAIRMPSTKGADFKAPILGAKEKKAVVARWAGAFALLSWIGFIELYIYMDYTRPHTIDLSAGRVYALNNHGSIAYLTQYEHTSLFAVAGFAAACVLIAIIANNASK